MFLKRRHANGQQAYEKMLKKHYLRHVNKIHNEMSPHTGQSSHPSSESLQILNTGKGVEKQNCPTLLCSCGKQYGIFLKNEK